MATAVQTKTSTSPSSFPTPPAPPKSQTIIVPTTSPLLIPDEGETYCFNRRNLFDIVIGLILAIGIIYFVLYNRRYNGMEDFGLGAMLGTTSGTMGSSTMSNARAVNATDIGSGLGQMGGYIKRLFA
jgi:hypothetical protein